jgi:dTDP-4-dehydrorhamnose reductase
VRLWVTGATGYLGGALVAAAREQGLDVDTERVEVRDEEAVRAHVERIRPDAVVHTAYRQDPAEAWSVNVDGSEHVARAAAGTGARLVHLSTDVVFGGRKGAPYVEADPTDPVTDYGRTKAEAERRVAAAHPAALVVRTSLIVGGPDGPESKHEESARSGDGTWYVNEIRSPVQVDDLVAALLELLRDHDVAGPLHVAGADAVSRHELAELAAGGPCAAGLAPPTRPLDCTLDSSVAQAMIGTRLRGVRELYR